MTTTTTTPLEGKGTAGHLRRGGVPAEGVLVVEDGVEEGGDGDDDVRGTEQGALEVVAAAVQDEKVDDEDGDEERDGLEKGKVERHVLLHAPAEKDDKWRDEERCEDPLFSALS